jgi:hypothetical protein
VVAVAYASSAYGPSVCHAEDVDVGVLPDGAYVVTFIHISPQAPQGVVWNTPGGGFVVWSRGATECSSSPRFEVSPMPPAAGRAFTLTEVEASPVGVYPATAVVTGKEIRVDDLALYGPPPGHVGCLRSPVTMTVDTPGLYMVHWYRAGIGFPLPDPPPIGSFSLQVVAAAPLLDPRALCALFVLLAIAGAWILRR